MHPTELTNHPYMPGNFYSERIGNLSKLAPQIACGSQISIQDGSVTMETLGVCCPTTIH